MIPTTVIDAIFDAGGRQLRQFWPVEKLNTLPDERFYMWAIKGKLVVIQDFGEDLGFEVYYQGKSRKVDEIIEEIKQY